MRSIAAERRELRKWQKSSRRPTHPVAVHGEVQMDQSPMPPRPLVDGKRCGIEQRSGRTAFTIRRIGQSSTLREAGFFYLK
jgi:hypothetical protein